MEENSLCTESALKYWRDNLNNLPLLELATDKPRFATTTYNTACLDLEIDLESTMALKKLGQQQDCTLYMTLLATFNVLLHRYTQQTDFCVGSKVQGDSENALVLRTLINEEASFNEYLASVRVLVLAAYEQQQLPLVRVKRALQDEYGLDYGSLFRATFVELSPEKAAINKTALDLFESELGLFFVETAQGVEGYIEYAQDLFDVGTIKQFKTNLLVLLDAVVANPHIAILQLEFLNHEKKQQILEQWNDTVMPYAEDMCIHQLFECQVDKAPDAVAVEFEGQSLTYRQLNEKANQLAAHLIELGVKPDHLVGICLERSLDLVIAIYGILKAGGAYVPLDPDYPSQRLKHMVEDAKFTVILTHRELESKIPDYSEINVYLDDPQTQSTLSQNATENPSVEEICLAPSNLVYMIYTSGSTGKPKGVMIEHMALVNRIQWMDKEYGCDSSDAILQKTPFSFDVSVWEFFWPLISGAKLVVAKPSGHKDPAYMSQLIQEQGVTKLHFVPSMLNAMLCSSQLRKCYSLKQVFCSGEALPLNYVELFFKQGLSAQLHNLYGPTEAAIDVSYWACSEQDKARTNIPIGKPIGNIQLYILDQHLQPCVPGAPGELHIGGVGLARGYMNREELTAEKFIHNPFSDNTQERLYKTGDLCRYLADGNIEYIGRIDHQVKIRGFRIELGEIESAIISHDAIQDAVVQSIEWENGSRSLIAYMVCESDLNLDALRTFLLQSLPEFMTPAHFVKLQEFPLSPSGKIDRNALLAMEVERTSTENQAPVDMSFMETEVYKIWCKILGFSDVQLDDDLFRVGGDSIMAVQIFVEINREFGVNIGMEKLFSSEVVSIRWLTALIEEYQVNAVGEEEYASLLSQIDGMSEDEIEALLAE